MKNHIVSIGSVLMLFGANEGAAQLLLNTAWDNTYLLSPASAGRLPYAIISAHYKKAGFAVDNCPEAQQIYADGPVAKGKLGIGGSFMNERAGLMAQFIAMGTISYHLKLNPRAKLSAGLSGGMSRRTINFLSIKAERPEELAGMTSIQMTYAPEAAAGLTYENRKLLVSFAANHLLNKASIYYNTTRKEALEINPLPVFVFSARQHIFAPGKTWQLSPAIVLRSFQGSDISPDASLSLFFKSVVALRAGVRPKSAWYGALTVALTKAIQFTYAYESNSMNRSLRAPGHEVAICLSLFRGDPSAVQTAGSDELKERLDIEGERVRSLQKNIDSLKANMARLESELTDLKSKQVDRTTIKNDFQAEAPGLHKPKYDFLDGNEYGEAKENSERGEFEIVYGVYQLPEYAKKYQKLLLRSLNIETRLIAPAGQRSHYIYVVSPKHYTKKEEAIAALENENEKVEGLSLKITNGTLWILHKKSEE